MDEEKCVYAIIRTEDELKKFYSSDGYHLYFDETVWSYEVALSYIRIGDVSAAVIVNSYISRKTLFTRIYVDSSLETMSYCKSLDNFVELSFVEVSLDDLIESLHEVNVLGYKKD